MEPPSRGCGVQPGVVFLMVTLLVTTMAAAMLCSAFMIDHWEYITWDRSKLEATARRVANVTTHSDHRYDLEWLLDGQVARVVLIEPRPRIKIKPGFYKINQKVDRSLKQEENLPALFFVPMHGGIWTQCVALTDEQRLLLDKMGFPQEQCTNYLTPELMREEGARTDCQHRMQNLSFSCSLVCLVILASSALVGGFGLTKHQIRAVLVTGVMYLLAATFAMFTLTIIPFKRAQSRAECPTDAFTLGLTVYGVVTSSMAQEQPCALGRARDYFAARVFTAGWTLHLGWGGAGMCVLVGLLWIGLSKIMIQPTDGFAQQ